LNQIKSKEIASEIENDDDDDHDHNDDHDEVEDHQLEEDQDEKVLTGDNFIQEYQIEENGTENCAHIRDDESENMNMSLQAINITNSFIGRSSTMKDLSSAKDEK
jgi:hypothetical protein